LIISSALKQNLGAVTSTGQPVEVTLGKDEFFNGIILNLSTGGLLDVFIVKNGVEQKIRLISGTALNIGNLRLDQIKLTVSKESSITSINYAIVYYTKKPTTDFEAVSLESSSYMQMTSVGNATTSNVDIQSPLDSEGNIPVAVKEPLPSGNNEIGLVGIASELYDTSGEVQSLAISVGTTAAPISSDTTLIKKITLLLPSGSTETVYVGNSTAQNFILPAGVPISLEMVKPNNIYMKASATVTVYVIYGGA